MTQDANQPGSDVEQAWRERSASLRSRQVDPSGTTFWLSAWFGTALAGGVFGAVEAGVLGCVAGVLYAGVAAAPVQATFAAATWILSLSPIRVLVAGVAGATTGVVATAVTFDSTLFGFQYEKSLVLAGAIGGVGGALPSGLYQRWSRQFGSASRKQDGAATQFSLRELFWRIAVAAVLLAFWTWMIAEFWSQS